MKKVIRLTENDLHRIIKASVKRVLKEEYGVAPDGRQINQQAAQQVASRPTSWKVQHSRGNYDKAQTQLNRQLGHDKPGPYGEWYSTGDKGIVHPVVNCSASGGERGLGYIDYRSQGDGSFWADFDKENGMKQCRRGGHMQGPDARNAVKVYNDMYDYYNGNWNNRMSQKAKQLGNGGVYESKRVSKKK